MLAHESERGIFVVCIKLEIGKLLRYVDLIYQEFSILLNNEVGTPKLIYISYKYLNLKDPSTWNIQYHYRL